MSSQKTLLDDQFKEELPYWLALNRLPGLTPRRFLKLFKQKTSLSDCFKGEEASKGLVAWGQQQGIFSFAFDWQGVKNDLEWSQQDDHHLLRWCDKGYPQGLREIEAAPPVLFVKGQIDALSTKQIALVGSRRPTPLGRENAYSFAYNLAKKGFTITSGLALGIDGASHEGCLAAGGITIAVLGSSLEQIYPPQHRMLAQQISKEGALISEFPIGSPPRAAHFPRRNRLISGLSRGVVVVESALKSGSLITANYALEQGREIFALPGSIHNPMAKGCHQLIRQGAKCVETVDHIMEELSDWPKMVEEEHSHCCIEVEEIEEEICPFLAQIEETCTPVDLIINKTGLTAEKVSSMLLELELQDKITSVPGGYIRVTKGRK